MFKNEEGSHIAFQVEGQIIPAHKDIFIQKSKYFASLFNSIFVNIYSFLTRMIGGMIETRQNVLDIPECEYIVFKGISSIFSEK